MMSHLLVEAARKGATDKAFTTYSLKHFWVDIAKETIDIESRYVLADHRLNIGIQDNVYATPMGIEKLRTPAQLVADRLTEIVATHS